LEVLERRDRRQLREARRSGAEVDAGPPRNALQPAAVLDRAILPPPGADAGAAVKRGEPPGSPLKFPHIFRKVVCSWNGFRPRLYAWRWGMEPQQLKSFASIHFGGAVL